jgi:hypothetical protein
MTDVAIKPATSVDDSGTVKLPEFNRSGRIIPTYLVTLHTDKKGVNEYFIATKFDDSFVHFGKFVGFYYGGSEDYAIERYEEIISTTQATKYVEILFPHHLIKSVRSLGYRHKATKQ